jgi:hypothetical protein
MELGGASTFDSCSHQTEIRLPNDQVIGFVREK